MELPWQIAKSSAAWFGSHYGGGKINIALCQPKLLLPLMSASGAFLTVHPCVIDWNLWLASPPFATPVQCDRPNWKHTKTHFSSPAGRARHTADICHRTFIKNSRSVLGYISPGKRDPVTSEETLCEERKGREGYVN